MTVSIPDALRAIAWLLQPWHFLAVYAFEVVELFLALVGAVTLGWLTLRRYGRALGALALVGALATGANCPVRAAAAPRRAGFAQHRVVHAAHAPRVRTAPATVGSARAPEPQPRPAACTAEGPARAVEPLPARPAGRRLPGLSEAQLLAMANNEVIGPLIEACRQAAGGAR